MPKIVFVQADGQRREVDAKVGQTVMEVACENAVEGVSALCGGQGICGTCHVYVDPGWQAKLTAPDDTEEFMLVEDGVLGLQSNSRLSCQLELVTEMDGLVLLVPEAQV